MRHHLHAHDADEPCAEQEHHALSSFASAIAPATRIILTHNSKRRKSSSRAIPCSNSRHSLFTSSSSSPDVSPSMATRTGAETTNASLSPNRNLVSTLPSFLYVTSLIFITQPPPSPLRSPAASPAASPLATVFDPHVLRERLCPPASRTGSGIHLPCASLPISAPGRPHLLCNSRPRLPAEARARHRS